MIDEKVIEQLKADAKGRELHLIEVKHDEDELDLVVVAPSRVEWAKFISELNSSDDFAKKRQAHESLVMMCSRYPAKDEIRKLFDRKFNVVPAITEKLADLVGAEAQVRAKKL